MRNLRLLPLLLLGAALFVGAGWALQWRRSIALREQVSLLQADERDLTRLRAENEKLKAERISPEALRRLRADHDALVRLQTEIQTLRESLQRRERALGTN